MSPQKRAKLTHSEETSVKTQYEAGDVVQSYRPFVAGVKAPSMKLRNAACSVCFRQKVPRIIGQPTRSLESCGWCEQVAYCSTDCRDKDHWLHVVECSYLQRAASNFSGNFRSLTLTWEERCVARCLLRIGMSREEGNSGQQEEIALVERALKLQGRGANVVSDDDGFVERIRKYLAGCKYVESMSDDEIKLCRERFDVHQRKVATYHVPAAVLSIEVSELKHSCDPSCSVVLRDDGLVYLVANRRIDTSADDKITISFINDMLPRKDRWRLLKTQFGMDECNCSLCETSEIASTTRDNYLRSIRCSVAFNYTPSGRRDNNPKCDEPIPISDCGKLAAAKCRAAGHEQTYSEQQLHEYRRALVRLGLLQADESGLPASFLAQLPAVEEAWSLVKRYWHPINAYVQAPRHDMFMSDDFAPNNMPKTAWQDTGFGAFYIANKMEIVQCFRDNVVKFDALRLYQQLLSGMISAGWGAGGVGENVLAWRCEIVPGMGNAVLKILAQLLPLAERYYGPDSERANAIRRASELSLRVEGEFKHGDSVPLDRMPTFWKFATAKKFEYEQYYWSNSTELLRAVGLEGLASGTVYLVSDDESSDDESSDVIE